MNVLVWGCPFPSQGDLFFFENSFKRHLCVQANLLASQGVSVTAAYPNHLSSAANELSSGVKRLELPMRELRLEWRGHDPLKAFYRDEFDINRAFADLIAPHLAPDFDVILTWENPVGYLRRLYPEALIINQMPGAFCRAPYPNTVTFDPMGLYQDGLLSRESASILGFSYSQREHELADAFRTEAKRTLERLTPLRREDLGRHHTTKTLLPLQITGHYAFVADTGFTSQVDLAAAVFSMASPDEDVIVTQYRSKFASDLVFSDQNIAKYKAIWPNLFWQERLENLQSPSQLLLPVVDQVITASSSIGLQAVCLGLPVKALGNTHLSPYDTEKLGAGGQARDSLTAFLLGRYQPLYSSITTDGPFLVSLLEEMTSRQGRPGADATASFFDMDAEYGHKLLQEFNPNAVSRSVIKHYPGRAASWKIQEQYLRHAGRPEVKYLTFDVFDTLIYRPTENPADVYGFLAAKLETMFGLRYPDFAKVRTDAEVRARQISVDPEISLAGIYDLVADHFGMSGGERDEVLQIEVDLETTFVAPRLQGVELWRLAKRIGKPIVLISDMYLPHNVVEAMVLKCGFKDYERLYVSSAHGARKKDGTLFDLVLSELGVEGSSVFHVGDHVVADIRNAQARGMLALRTPRAIDVMRKNESFGAVYRHSVGGGLIGRSALAGLTASRLFDLPIEDDGSLFRGDARNLGYAALGPLYVGFALWLRDQAQQQGAGRLYFLSREGKLLKQVYDVLTEGVSTAPVSTYLYASRRAIRVASIKSERDALEVAGQPYRDGVPVVELLKERFNLDAALVVQHLSHFGEGPSATLSKLEAGRSLLRVMVRSLLAEIMKVAEDERGHYLRYLEKEGLTGQDPFGIVDLGWKGNMQGGLGRLLGKPLVGYYYATLAGAERWEVEGHVLRGYAGECIGPWSKNHLVKRRHLTETLACHDDPTLLTVQARGDGFVPIFRDSIVAPSHRLVINQVHGGAVAFAHDFRRSYQDFLPQMRIDPELAASVISSFMEKPHPLDAALLRGLVFEDGFGGVNAESIMDSGSNIWPEGATKASPVPARAAVAVDKAVKTPKPAPQAKKPKEIAIAAEATVGALGADPVPVSAGRRYLRMVESLSLRSFTKGQKKQKYLRNPERYFQDSKSKILRFWGTIR